MSDERAHRLFHDVFVEAARACGDDPLAIARFVADRVATMSADERALFNGVAEDASAFEAPSLSAKPN